MLLIMTAERGGGRARQLFPSDGAGGEHGDETGQRVGAVAKSAGRGDEFSCERVCVRARSRLKV